MSLIAKLVPFLTETFKVFVGAGLYTLGVANPCGDFDIGAAGFFVAFIMFFLERKV
jgi:hypothetical protein